MTIISIPELAEQNAAAEALAYLKAVNLIN